MDRTDAANVSIRRLAGMSEGDAVQLAEVLIDCVDGGASVSFMHPLDVAKARAFWLSQADDIASGARIVLVAEDDHGILGTVQVIVRQPDNQPHRADVAKMLVHRRVRRRGIGGALMQAAEAQARAAGKSLLVLDTATGSDAERLYRRCGWIACGVIPNYALWPRGGYCSTSLYYRRLD